MLYHIHTTGLHDLRCIGIIDQRKQQMFQGGIFMAAVGGIVQRLMQRFFERFSKGRHSSDTPHRAQPPVFMHYAREKSRASVVKRLIANAPNPLRGAFP